MAKVIYTPLGIAFGVVGGIIGGAIFLAYVSSIQTISFIYEGF